MIISPKMKNIILPESYKFISAFLTFRCNLDCSFCVNYSSNKNFKRNRFDEMSGEDWVKSLNRIESSHGVPITFLGGEPSIHKDFIYIINNLKPELEIDIQTNLWWNKKKLDRFVREVSPERIKRNSPYPSIRVSYHPETMKEGERVVENAIILKENGFDIGMESVMHPSPLNLEALEKMSLKCKNVGLNFREKSFLGIYEGNDDLGRPFSITYGDYSKYPGAIFGKKSLNSMCKTSDLLINPEGDIYRCQRDILLTENSIGNLLNSNFQLSNKFRPCHNYGQCHPCDVKVRTDYKQKFGHTGVEIKDIN